MQNPFFTSTLKAPDRFRRWQASLLTMLLLGGLTPAAQAQVPAGTYTIGTAPYTSIAAAIALMNGGTGVAGNVIFNVPVGYTETFATAIAGRITTATTTATKTVVFQKNGVGTNPLITMATNAGTGTLDAIISLVGTDYVTFDGISVSDANNAAATATQQMEFGYAMFRPTTANGSQFNNIKNCAITLNKANVNTIGVYLANTDAAGVLLTPGGGSTQVQTSNVISGNTITNCFSGIAVLGAATGTNFDVTNTIGGATAAAGNTISNIGGSDAVLYGIRAESQTSLIIQNNSVTVAAGNATTNVYGIGVGVAIPLSLKSTVSLPLVISNNTVTITSATTGGVWGIYQAATAGAAVGITIANNKVQNMSLTGNAASVAGIQNDGPNSSGSAVAVVSGNEVSNNTTATTNTFTGIYQNGPNHNSLNITSNKVQNNVRSGTNATAANNVFYGIRVPSVGSNATTAIFTTNLVTDNQLTASNGTFYGMYFFKGTPTFTGNTLTNNTIPSTVITTGDPASALYGIYDAAQATSTPATITGNTITGLSIGGTNNSTASAVAGIVATGSAAAHVINTNVVGGLALNAGSGTVSGLLTIVGTGASFTRNKFYDLSASGSAGLVYGINVTNTSTTTTLTIANNLIGDLRAPAATSNVALSGIGLITSSGSVANVYHNTILLNAAATPTATFGSSGVYVASSNPSLDLRNNIIVNNSNTSTSGTSYSVAVRNNSLAQQATTSNNNLLYAGGGTHNAIYAEAAASTNVQLTLAAFKAYMVSPREANSVTENPTFLSTTGTAATFLHLSPTVGTLAESGATTSASSGITVDYDNDARQGSAGYPSTSPNGIGQVQGGGTSPDIGADEGTFTVPTPIADVSPTALTAPASGSSCRSSTETVTVTVQNAGTTPLDFSSTAMTVTVTVTKPDATTQVFTTTISDNSGNPTSGSPLAVGASRNVALPGTLDMTMLGTYSFAVSATVTGDANTGNDNLATQTRVVAAPTVGTASSNVSTFCATTGATPTLTVAGVTNGTVQWQSSSTTGGPYADISGANSNTYVVSPGITATTYYRAEVRCPAQTAAASNEVAVTASNPTVGTAMATPASFCPSVGAAPVLSLTAFANGALQWQVSNTGMAGSFSNLSGGTTNPFTAPLTMVTQYYQAVITCGATTATSNTVSATATNPTVGTATASPTYFGTCTASSTPPVLTVSAFASGNLQWQSSGTGLAGSFTDISGGTTNPFIAPAVSAVTYYQAVVSCGATTATSNVVSVEPIAPTITGTNTPVSRCDVGTVTLTATTNPGSTIKWYDTNVSTTVLATGGSFSPSVTSSRQYFVGASVVSGATANAARPAPTTVPTSQNTTLINSGLQFNATSSFVLLSVTVYPTLPTASTPTFSLKTSTGTVLASAVVNIPAGSGTGLSTVPVVVPLNFNVPVGTGLLLLADVNPSALYRENTGVYPIASPNGITITAGINPAVTSGSYYFFYNWQIGSYATCNSARTPVNVIVNPPPTATLTAGGSCVGNTSTVSVAFPVGTAPFTFDYTIDGVAQPTVTTSTNPYVFTTAALTTSTTYALTSLTDAYCTATAGTITTATVTVTPNSTTTFTGAVNSDWMTAGNWTNCIPTAIIDAIIPTGKTATLANGAAIARDLVIQGSGVFNLTGATATLTLKGNLTTASASSYVASAGTTTFDGTAGQTVAAATYYNLTLDGSTAKVLGGDISVGNILDLTTGLLAQGNNQVRLTGTASAVSGAGPGHLLVQTGTGRLRIDNVGTGAGTRASAFFPVGTSAAAADYTPITVANSGTTDYFLGSVADGITSGTVPTSHAVNKTWDISEGTIGGSNASLTLQWNAANELPSLNRSLVGIAHYTGGAWAASCFTCFGPASGSDPYSVTRGGFTSFSPFGVEDGTKPLPVELSRFAATRQGADAKLTWATASEKNNAGFGVEVSTNGNEFRQLGFVAGAGSSTAPHTYAYLDTEKGKAGTRYYRLRQVDADGTTSYSPVRTVDFGLVSETRLSAAPNPFGGELTLHILLPAPAAGAVLTVSDATGRLVRQQTMSLPAGATVVELTKLEALPSGTYFLNLTAGDQIQHLKVVKQ